MRKQKAVDPEVPRRLQKWLENNKDAVHILGRKIRELDTVRKNQYSHYSVESRQLAIEIIESWLREVYGVAWSSEFMYPEEDDQIYTVLDKPLD